uniref:Uncharacterized protein n=1 Tax=Rhizophora mucronata TaxID=61149 RepID=A0A2P2QEH7_RHIMU
MGRRKGEKILCWLKNFWLERIYNTCTLHQT